MRWWRRVALWSLPSAVFAMVAAAAYHHVHLEVPPRLSAAARAAAMAPLRAVLDERPMTPPAHPELSRALPGGGPAVVTVWHAGAVQVRAIGYGASIAEAIVAAAEKLAVDPRLTRLSRRTRAQARVQLDLVVARGPLPRVHPLVTALAVNPGLDGVGVHLTELPSAAGPPRPAQRTATPSSTSCCRTT